MIEIDTLPIGISELLGALFGVLIGQILTIWWDRKKRREYQEEQRQQTTRSIASELQDICADLERLDDNPETQPNFPYSTAAYRSSVASGRFSLIVEGDQLSIAQIYEHVSQVQDIQEQLQRSRLRSDETNQAYRRRLHARFNDHINALQEQLPEVIDSLENGQFSGDKYLASVRQRYRGLFHSLR